jgi:hypothetical protein
MRCRRFWLALLPAIDLMCCVVAAQAAPPYRGRTVQSVVNELREAGLPLVYSTNLLPDTLVVEREPVAVEPLAVAREILEPYGLALRQSGDAWLVVRARPPAAELGTVALTVVAASSGEPLSASVSVDAGNEVADATHGEAELSGIAAGRHSLDVSSPGYLPERIRVEVRANESTSVTVALAEIAPRLDEVTVTASRYDLRQSVEPSATSFSRDEIETLAEIGDDTVRVAHRLPGIASNEFSARSHVRGGATDEMTVMLDGMRLTEPYHVRDYQAVFSAIDPRIVMSTEMYSGGFPAAYGGALSGLMRVESREPTSLSHEIGISFLYTSALSSGTFAAGRASWLVSARRSNLADLVEEEIGDPAYNDVFARVSVQVAEKHRLSFYGMAFDDDIVAFPSRDVEDMQEARAGTDNRDTWLALDSEWSERLSSRTWLYARSFRSERRESVADLDELIGRVDDRRNVEGSGVKQEWRYEASGRQLLSFGFEWEDLDASYAYFGEAERLGLLATLEPSTSFSRTADLDARGRSGTLFVSDRVRLTQRLIAELGLRWDWQRFSPGEDHEQLAPRSSLLFRAGSRTDLRLSYGRYFQPERMIDLEVEDGETELGRVQSASHSILGFEHRFGSSLTLRVEAFRKWTKSPRPRYENLFDPLRLLAEMRPGRVRVTPVRADTRGVEVLLDGGSKFPWWIGYSLSRAEDDLDGVRVPRAWDQRHALDAGVTWKVGPWSLSAAGSSHSGWPATELRVERGPSGYVVVAGPRNAQRLRGLQRIDFRASRDFVLRATTLVFFAELTNVTDRRNPCCVGYEPGPAVDGVPTLMRVERRGLPFTGNIGVRVQF